VTNKQREGNDDRKEHEDVEDSERERGGHDVTLPVP
jgi:hypothetical protein